MSVVEYPVNQSEAVRQHLDGDTEHWAACNGCGAGDGERCYSMTQRRGRERHDRKKRPCAGRVWRAAP